MVESFMCSDAKMDGIAGAGMMVLAGSRTDYRLWFEKVIYLAPYPFSQAPAAFNFLNDMFLVLQQQFCIRPDHSVREPLLKAHEIVAQPATHVYHQNPMGPLIAFLLLQFFQ